MVAVDHEPYAVVDCKPYAAVGYIARVDQQVRAEEHGAHVAVTVDEELVAEEPEEEMVVHPPAGQNQMLLFLPPVSFSQKHFPILSTIFPGSCRSNRFCAGMFQF